VSSAMLCCNRPYATPESLPPPARVCSLLSLTAQRLLPLCPTGISVFAADEDKSYNLSPVCPSVYKDSSKTRMVRRSAQR
jgi:hypothetical protein